MDAPRRVHLLQSGYKWIGILPPTAWQHERNVRKHQSLPSEPFTILVTSPPCSSNTKQGSHDAHIFLQRNPIGPTTGRPTPTPTPPYPVIDAPTWNYSGPVTGPVVVWAFENGQPKWPNSTLSNGPGPYSLQLPKNRNYDVKAFRDGNGNGNLDAGWQVGEPYAHHGDWNSTSSSFNTLLLDGNKTGIDLNISWHNDSDGDGFHDWDEPAATTGTNTSWPGSKATTTNSTKTDNHGRNHRATRTGTDPHGRTTGKAV